MFYQESEFSKKIKEISKNLKTDVIDIKTMITGQKEEPFLDENPTPIDTE